MKKSSAIKEYLKSIKLIASDYLLAFGFLFFIPFAAFAWKFMVTSDPSQIPFVTVQMIIVCFSISAFCWGVYLILEAKAGRVKNNIFVWLWLFFVIISIVAVVIQSSESSFLVECKRVTNLTEKFYPGTELGSIVSVHQHISSFHKLFFAMGSVLITTIFYIIFFVLPKRITRFEFLSIICVIVAIFMLIVTIYSYIHEWDEYGLFLKALSKGDDYYIISQSSITSFLVNRVPYGACLMMGIMFMLLGHHWTHKKIWLVIAVYCYTNMIFTWCKTSLTISTVIFILYFVFTIVTSFKKHLIRNLIFSIVFGLVFTSVVSIVLVSVLTKGRFVYQIYNIFVAFTEKSSLIKRTYIWGNIRNELKGGWIVIGRGFGTHNVLLYPMNLVNGDDVCPSHSTYYGILGAGGIINLLGFIGMFVYFVYAFIKCWKVNKVKTIGLSLPVLAYFMYSFTECINYLWLVFMFPIILFYNLIKKEMIKI